MKDCIVMGNQASGPATDQREEPFHPPTTEILIPIEKYDNFDADSQSDSEYMDAILVNKASNMGYEVPKTPSPRRRLSMMLDDVSTASGSMWSHSETKSLLEGTAAIFAVLKEDEDAMDDFVSLASQGDVSITDRSAAVFDHLQEETRRGQKATVRDFLETAAVVGTIAQRKQTNAAENRDDVSISDETADIFQALEAAESRLSQNHSKAHVDETIDRMKAKTRNIFDLLDDYSSENNVVKTSSSKRPLDSGDAVAPSGDAAGHPVDSCLGDHSAAIFQILSNVRSIDDRSVTDFSQAIFDMMDDSDFTEDDDTSVVSEKSTIIQHLLGKRGDRSHTAESVGIFNFLEREAHRVKRERERMISPASAETQRMGQTMGPRPILIKSPHVRTKLKSPYSKIQSHIILEEPEIHNEKEGDDTEGMNQEVRITTGNKFVPDEVLEEYPEVEGRQKAEVPTWALNTDDIELDEDEVDMEFVAKFDKVFDTFIAKNPAFLLKDPDLVHNYRVTKLQKILEFQQAKNNHFSEVLSKAKKEKVRMETNYHTQLKEVSRKKAEREVTLQEELIKLQNATELMQAKLSWALIELTNKRARTQDELIRHYKKIDIDSNPRALLEALPSGREGVRVRDAAQAPFWNRLESLGEDDLRKLQVDNAFIKTEMRVLRKKLEHQEILTKKHDWAEQLLARLDDKAMETLKKRHQAKTGVKF